MFKDEKKSFDSLKKYKNNIIFINIFVASIILILLFTQVSWKLVSNLAWIIYPLVFTDNSNTSVYWLKYWS